MEINLYEEFEFHLLNDIKPSTYFNTILIDKNKYNYNTVKILIDLSKIQQNPKYHPEGNVFNHTMEVVDKAAKIKSLSSNDRVFMWAALLHDVGKITTTKVRKGRITSYGHDEQGEKIARDYLLSYTKDMIFIEKIVKLVRWHMQPLFICKNLPFADIDKMMKETSLVDIACISICDRLGRGIMSKNEIREQKEFIIRFLDICYKKVLSKDERKRVKILRDILTIKDKDNNMF